MKVDGCAKDYEHHWAKECTLCGEELGKVYKAEDVENTSDKKVDSCANHSETCECYDCQMEYRDELRKNTTHNKRSAKDLQR